MTNKRGKSKRRAHVKRRHAARRAAPPIPRREHPPNAWELAAVRGIAASFLLGGAIALSEGHGELPDGIHHPTQSIAKLAIQASTTSSSGLFGL